MTQNLQKQNLCTSPLWDGVVVLTILCALGFPGRLGEAMGSGVNLLLQYLPFVLQLLVMLFSSADRAEELQLIHLEKKYLPVYLMLLGWFGLSMLVTSFPKEQFIACTRFTVTAFFALWMSERYDPERLLKMTLYAEMLFVCSTLLSVLLFPRASFSYEAGERALRGICPSKNSCAYVLSFGLVMQAAFARVQGSRKLPRFFAATFLLQAILLILCRSTGATLFALLVILYLLVLEPRMRHRLNLAWVYIVGSVGFLIMALTVLPLFEPLLRLIGKDATLSARTPTWRQLVELMTKHHTFTGFGLSMFWKDPAAVRLFHQGFSGSSWHSWMTSGAHNAILEIWLDVGLIGLALFFFLLLRSFRRITELSREQYLFCSACLLWQITKGLLERSYIPFNYQTLFLFLCIGVACNRAAWAGAEEALPEDPNGRA